MAEQNVESLHSYAGQLVEGAVVRGAPATRVPNDLISNVKIIRTGKKYRITYTFRSE